MLLFFRMSKTELIHTSPAHCDLLFTTRYTRSSGLILFLIIQQLKLEQLYQLEPNIMLIHKLLNFSRHGCHQPISVKICFTYIPECVVIISYEMLGFTS